MTERAAELREELLFKQPEISHRGECPICCLPIPLGTSEFSLQLSCCSKDICNGCYYANLLRLRENPKRKKEQISCPFCRSPLRITSEDEKRNRMKRIEADDPVAIYKMGAYHRRQQNYSGAFELWTKAAELGDAGAHYGLAWLYINGHSVERDEKKAIYHWEEAAIGGHPESRHNLGVYECKLGSRIDKGAERTGRYEKAIKHFIIAANLGHDRSMEKLKDGYKLGAIKKEQFAAALRAHKAAVDATKSPQREAAEARIAKIRSGGGLSSITKTARII